MKCPNCSAELRMSERKGVEIDYCPTCRGIWLDRGELDKLLEHADREQVSRDRHDDDDDDDDHHKRRDNRGTPPYGSPPKQSDSYPKKRESFWGELFDFG
jgi:Zn-finger nucleic acid-binding protein